MSEITDTKVPETTEVKEETINPFDESPKEKKVPLKEEPKVEDKAETVEVVDGNKPKEVVAKAPKEKVEPIKEVEKVESKFANKTSENIYKHLLAGDEDKVLDYLSKKKSISSLDTMTPEQKIKLSLKNGNEGLSDADISDLYEEKFTPPEKPIQGLDELDEEFAARESKYEDKLGKFQRKLEREAKSASTELRKQIEELVLADITKTNELDKNVQSQEELDAIDAKREVYLNSIDKGLSDFKSIDANYKDKDVEIPVAYSISEDEKKELKDTMENFNLEKFIQDRWITEDGQFNTAQQAKDIFMLTHGDKAIADLINKVGSKRHAETIKAQKNVNYSGNTRSGNLEPSVQEAMDKAAAHFFSN